MSLEDNSRRDDPSTKSRELSWPTTGTVYLTLDLECDFGTALTKNTYEALDHVDEVVSLLEGTDIPLTCFVQTEVLDERPEVGERLRSCGATVEFHPHSHTHSTREATSIANEIGHSTRRYREFFGRDPVGYRFPNGNVRPSDYRHLSTHGYRFDASVFPTWRPGHFDKRDAPTVPTYMSQFDILELPFTVASSRLPIPTGLSYCRLFGRPLTYILTRDSRRNIVFNFHLHDLVTPETVSDLSPLYRAIYRRNDHGLSLLRDMLDAFQDAGFDFDTLGNAHTALRETL
ncbi:polysaccharide deacetylase family protein [Halomicroarcula sp. GCM10025817]|uniref:polysaccharide deacetylase family protein n=1 Tax=Haloarcula TaxID=2237 RepID=UPI0023E7ABB8|nr:polysaccharide deacetylase family protein [Halomicroarcula sp. SYNS111]